MRIRTHPARLVFGRTVLERLGGASPPPELRPFIDAFRQEHERLEVACVEAQRAEARRREVMEAVARADSALGVSVEELVVALIAARKADRRKPLASYTGYNVSRLLSLACLKEAEEVEQIAARISKEEPPEPVVAAIAACLQQAAAVKGALSNLSGPQVDYQRKLAARDALVADWERALSKLRLRAAVAWENEPQAVEVIFARPARVQQPATRRHGKKGGDKPGEPEPTPT